MNRLIKYFLIGCFCFLGLYQSSKAQSYFGYQMIGRQTYFFSVSYNGTPNLGFGYSYRTFSPKSFNEWHAEVRFPLADMYQWRNFTAIAGVYRPSRLSRTWVGLGAHIRYRHESGVSNEINEFQLGLTALPSYTYTASLQDGAYGTFGARVTYLPTIYSSVNEVSTWFSKFDDFELGFHTDVLLERAVGLAVNIYKPISVTTKPEMIYPLGGDFYFGPNF